MWQLYWHTNMIRRLVLMRKLFVFVVLNSMFWKSALFWNCTLYEFAWRSEDDRILSSLLIFLNFWVMFNIQDSHRCSELQEDPLLSNNTLLQFFINYNHNLESNRNCHGTTHLTVQIKILSTFYQWDICLRKVKLIHFYTKLWVMPTGDFIESNYNL